MKKFQSVTNLVNIFLKEAQTRRRIVPSWQPEKYTEDPEDTEQNVPSGPPRVQDFSIPNFGDIDIDEPVSAPVAPPKKEKIEETVELTPEEIEMERERKKALPPIARKVDPHRERRYDLWGRPSPGFEFEQGESKKDEPRPKSDLENFKRIVEKEETGSKADRFSRFMEDADKSMKEQKEQSLQSKREEEAASEKTRHEQLVERAREEMAQLTQIEDILKTHSLVKKKRSSRPEKGSDLRGNRWIEVKFPKSVYKDAHSMWFLVDGRDPDFARNLLLEHAKLRDALRSKKEYLRV